MTRIPVEDRRRALVAAAIRVIAADGMAAATTRAVAAEAGMSLASLHYVFGSRDALLEAVIEQVTTAEARAAEEVMALFIDQDAPIDLSALLDSGIERFIDGLVAEPDNELALAELSIHARRAGMDDLVERQRQIYLDAAARTLSAAAAQTGSAWSVPLAEVAMLLTTVLDGITYSWLSHRDEAAARTSGRFSAHALAGLATTSSTSPADVTSDAATRPEGALTC